MKNYLTVVLGAGFSANAGMPMASNIAERFDRDLRGKILSASSGEWYWSDGKSVAERNNGILNFDYLAYSYVFNELVKKYKADNGDLEYYEDFYQFIIDNYSSPDWIENLFDTAKEVLLKDRPYLTEDDYSKHYLFSFETKQFWKVGEILNYLIGDILSIIPKSNEELIEIYQGFIDYISKFDRVDIFTLNHDLLLERVLELNNIPFSKGFSSENSPVLHRNSPVPYFNNIFDQNIRVYKLHGSLDFIQFRHYVKDGGHFLKPTGGYDYYMTSNYDTKHNSVLVDPKTGKVLQDQNLDILPKFITGTKKMDTIKNDILFKKLFENFNSVMDRTKNLFVSGYSFSDEHLNENLKSKGFNYINHNRRKEYPFGGKGKNIKSLNEL